MSIVDGILLYLLFNIFLIYFKYILAYSILIYIFGKDLVYF